MTMTGPDGVTPCVYDPRQALAGVAARYAARTLKKRLAAAADPGSSLAERIAGAAGQGIPTTARYEYWAPKTQPLGTGGDMHVAFSFAAQAALCEVDMRTGEVEVRRIIAAHDVGRAINPLTLEGQIEGGIVQGLSAALRERITVADGRIVEGNFGDYRILRINESPLVIETYFAETDAHPTGLGEPSVPPIAAALANAIYAATGKRHRSLPIEI